MGSRDSERGRGVRGHVAVWLVPGEDGEQPVGDVVGPPGIGMGGSQFSGMPSPSAVPGTRNTVPWRALSERGHSVL